MRQRQRGAFMEAISNAVGNPASKPRGNSRGKYGAVKTAGYDSKAEYAYACDLLLRKTATNGDVLDWLEQISIKLTAGIKYRVDFLVFKRDGSWELVEVKGFETKEWQMKMKLMKEHRPELYARLRVVK